MVQPFEVEQDNVAGMDFVLATQDRVSLTVTLKASNRAQVSQGLPQCRPHVCELWEMFEGENIVTEYFVYFLLTLSQHMRVLEHVEHYWFNTLVFG